MNTLPTVAESEKAIDEGSSKYLLGCGKDREGYHIPGSRWVYKLAKYPEDRVNENEYQRYIEITQSGRLPENVRIPEMHLLPNGVIAAEYVDGDRPRCSWRAHDEHPSDYVCWKDSLRKVEHDFNMSDSSAACNLRLTTIDGAEILYIIDLGE